MVRTHLGPPVTNYSALLSYQGQALGYACSASSRVRRGCSVKKGFQRASLGSGGVGCGADEGGDLLALQEQERSVLRFAGLPVSAGYFHSMRDGVAPPWWRHGHRVRVQRRR
jgi:hypothetical protein